MINFLIFFWFFVPFLIRCDIFHENLEIVHLPNNNLAAKLHFTTLKPIAAGEDWAGHYDLFPKTIGDLVEKYKLNEFHLSLTQGFWRVRQWGYPIIPSSAPTGAQLWAWFLPNVENVDETWRNFIHALSGVFCASFSQIDKKFTVAPEYAYRPEGAFAGDANNKFVRYGILSSENVCTENLTPWKKLLPCKSGGGIARLLNPVNLYGANYHSLNVDFRRVCVDENCKSVTFELTQTIVVVFDHVFGRSWTLMNLFGSFIDKPCSVATSSVVRVKIPSKLETKFSPVVNNSGDQFVEGELNVKEFRVDEVLKVHNYLNLLVEYSKKPANDAIQPPAISLHSYIAGTGQAKGVLTSSVENTDVSSRKILYSHIIPWFLRVYYHTLAITCNENPTKPDFIIYQPARDRQRPHYFEIVLNVPPKSVCKVTMGFSKSLLKWTEYPPDANHGFFVPGPSISFHHSDVTAPERSVQFDNPSRKNFLRIHGEALLINLPTPDFSMPYNVICLVCTVVALAFGPIHNLTTRRLSIKHPEEVKRKGLSFKLKNFIAGLNPFTRRRKEKPKED